MTYLIILSLEKEIIVLLKNLEKVLNIFSGICVKRKRITSGFQKVKQGCWNGPKRIVPRPVSIGFLGELRCERRRLDI